MTGWTDRLGAGDKLTIALLAVLVVVILTVGFALIRDYERLDARVAQLEQDPEPDPEPEPAPVPVTEPIPAQRGRHAAPPKTRSRDHTTPSSEGLRR